MLCSKSVILCLCTLQYMVLYQLLLALMFDAAFYMDGSQFNNQQVRQILAACTAICRGCTRLADDTCEQVQIEVPVAYLDSCNVFGIKAVAPYGMLQACCALLSTFPYRALQTQ